MKPLILLFFFFIITSCKQNEEYHLVNDDMKGYFGSCKDGSWWVYRNISGDISDSAWITDYTVDNRKTGKNIFYESITYTLNIGGKKSPALLSTDENGTTCFGYTDNSDSNYLSSFPQCCIKDIITVNYCNPCSVHKFDSLVAGDFVFKDILKISSEGDTFYYARNKGLIKFYISGRSWQVKKLSVVL